MTHSNRGRRLVVAATVIGLGLLLAIPAQAGLKFTDNQYEGRAERDPFTYFGFDITSQDGRKKVAKVTARLSYQCAGGSGGRATARARGKLAIEDGAFAGRLSVPQDQIPTRARGASTMTYDLTGELRRRGRARGTIDAVIRFAAAPRRRGGNRCYSGKLDWRARRGAEVEPILPP
jgi:hypothetical protein